MDNQQIVASRRITAIRRGLATASALALVSGANAAIDTSSVTTAISDGSGAVTTVGVAVLGVMVLIAVYKWIRRAL